MLQHSRGLSESTTQQVTKFNRGYFTINSGMFAVRFITEPLKSPGSVSRLKVKLYSGWMQDVVRNSLNQNRWNGNVDTPLT